MSETKLLEWVAIETGRPVNRIISDIDDPRRYASRWFDFLDEQVANLWPELSGDAKLLAYCYAVQELRDLDIDSVIS
jgi:hypothetical protein